MIESPRHLSVLPTETIALLDPQPGEVWIDATVGLGGHTRMIAERVGPTGRVIGLDQDQEMLTHAKSRLEGLPVTLIHANFDQLSPVLMELDLSTVDGVLADLGICSDQLDDAERGLSFQKDGPLDMRMDRENGEPASALIARMSEGALADLIFEFGEERLSRRIARRIVEERERSPIETTSHLSRIVRSCVPRSRDSHRIDPATRTFQALRIAVNDELGALDRLLKMLARVVKPGGRAGLISFHSLEDRRVKNVFREADIWDVKTRKPVEASDEETARNPRARSAKLRVAVRK